MVQVKVVDPDLPVESVAVTTTVSGLPSSYWACR